MASFSTLIPVTDATTGATLRIGTSQLVKVMASGSGAAVYYFDNSGSLSRVVVTETPAAISTASQVLVSLTVTGGTIYLNANLFVLVQTDGGAGSIVTYYNPEAATQESYEASESPAALQTAISAISASSGGAVTTGLVAFAGGGQGSATQLSFGYNEVITVATAGDSVKLQPAQAGAQITVINDGANAMDVFPATGDTINDGAANTAISVAAGVTIVFSAINATNWESGMQTVETTKIVVTGTTDSTTKDTGSIVTKGGIGAEKAIFAGTTINAGTRILTGAGAVGTPSLVVGANDNGQYEISATQQGFSIGNALVGGYNANGFFTGVIEEQVASAGVAVDSVLLKDGGVSDTGATIFADFTPILAQDDIAAGAGGAIAVTNYLTTVNTDAGGDAFTLTNATQIGQLKKILLVVDGGGDAVITPTALSGGTTITMGDATDYVILKWTGAAWICIENFGCVIA